MKKQENNEVVKAAKRALDEFNKFLIQNEESLSKYLILMEEYSVNDGDVDVDTYSNDLYTHSKMITYTSIVNPYSVTKICDLIKDILGGDKDKLYLFNGTRMVTQYTRGYVFEEGSEFNFMEPLKVFVPIDRMMDHPLILDENKLFSGIPEDDIITDWHRAICELYIKLFNMTMYVRKNIHEIYKIRSKTLSRLNDIAFNRIEDNLDLMKDLDSKINTIIDKFVEDNFEEGK